MAERTIFVCDVCGRLAVNMIVRDTSRSCAGWDSPAEARQTRCRNRHRWWGPRTPVTATSGAKRSASSRSAARRSRRRQSATARTNAERAPNAGYNGRCLGLPLAVRGNLLKVLRAEGGVRAELIRQLHERAETRSLAEVIIDLRSSKARLSASLAHTVSR